MPLKPSLGARYGWRACLGYIVPSTRSEAKCYEFYMMAPDGVTIVVTSLGVRALSQEEYDGALGRFGPAVKDMADGKVNAIVQSGVPPIVTHGWGFADEVLAQARQITDIPVVLDISACIEAMRAQQMQRVVMLAQFDDEMYGHLTRYVKNAGIDVVAAAGVPWTEDDISRVPLAEPYRAAKALYRSAGPVDGIWITGAFMPSVAIIEPLEQDLGVPVVSSMQAMTWAGLRRAGVDTTEVTGCGRLFQVA